MTNRNMILMAPLAAGIAISAIAGAHAEDYPNEPIQLYVAYSAGSTTDVVARLVAEELSERLGQPVVVEYRTGAGGQVAATATKNATPDGYTIGMVVSGNSIQPWIETSMEFDLLSDFEKLTLMYAGPYVLSVHPDFPAETFDEFMDYVRENPGEVFYGSSGTNTTTHLAGVLLEQLGEVEMEHVPYQGSPQVYAALQANEVNAYFDLYATARSNIENGTIKPLAVSGQDRLDALPDLPAISETYPDFNVLAWVGFALPLGTPDEIVERLTEELQAVYQLPEIQQRFDELGIQLGGNSPDEFSQFVEQQYQMWGNAIQGGSAD